MYTQSYDDIIDDFANNAKGRKKSVVYTTFYTVSCSIKFASRLH